MGAGEQEAGGGDAYSLFCLVFNQRRCGPPGWHVARPRAFRGPVLRSPLTSAFPPGHAFGMSAVRACVHRARSGLPVPFPLGRASSIGSHPGDACSLRGGREPWVNPEMTNPMAITFCARAVWLRPRLPQRDLGFWTLAPRTPWTSSGLLGPPGPPGPWTWDLLDLGPWTSGSSKALDPRPCSLDTWLLGPEPTVRLTRTRPSGM